MRTILTITALFMGVSAISQELVNLGRNINSPDHTDCYPEVSADGQTIYFSRQSYPGDQGGYDIYFSTLDENGEWREAEPIVELNNENKNAVFYSSPNGDELIIFGNYGNNPIEQGFSTTRRTKNGWSDPEPLIIQGQEDIDWGSNGCTFSSDCKVMIIVIDADLYVSFKEQDGSWSPPKDIGSPCNTENYEFSPFLSDDNKTLYFSSDGHETLGLNDIVKTTRLDDTWLNWSEPVNVGKPINSTGWESFFSVSAQGSNAFVYSLNEGDGDLFKVPITEDMRPENVVILTGKIANAETGEFIVSAQVFYANQENENLEGIATINQSTSEYKIILHYGHVYEIKGVAPEFASFVETIDLTEKGPYLEMEQDILLVPLRKGANLKLENIQFESGRNTLIGKSFKVLNKVVKMMKDSPDMKIEIQGHTDNIGSDNSNQLLSNARASAVVEYLISQGISKDRLKSKGYGASKPIADNGSEYGRKMNRRVELVVISF